jgi:hypothetical protein
MAFVYIAAVFLVLPSFVAAVDDARDEFRFRSDTELHRLAADPATGMLYVGATNRLYRIEPLTTASAEAGGRRAGAERRRGLRLVETASIGPRLDDPVCTERFGERPCGGSTTQTDPTLTDNVVKVLVVDSVNGKLVTCGSIFQVGSPLPQHLNYLSPVRRSSPPYVERTWESQG